MEVITPCDPQMHSQQTWAMIFIFLVYVSRILAKDTCLHVGMCWPYLVSNFSLLIKISLNRLYSSEYNWVSQACKYRQLLRVALEHSQDESEQSLSFMPKPGRIH